MHRIMHYNKKQSKFNIHGSEDRPVARQSILVMMMTIIVPRLFEVPHTKGCKISSLAHSSAGLMLTSLIMRHTSYHNSHHHQLILCPLHDEGLSQRSTIATFLH